MRIAALAATLLLAGSAYAAEPAKPAEVAKPCTRSSAGPDLDGMRCQLEILVQQAGVKDGMIANLHAQLALARYDIAALEEGLKAK